MEARVSSSNISIEDFIKEAADNEKEIKGKGYINPNGNITGIYLCFEDDPSISIDITLEKSKLIQE